MEKILVLIEINKGFIKNFNYKVIFKNIEKLI